MLYAHKHDEHEEELLTNLAKIDAKALPFPAKNVSDDDDDDDFMSYEASNSRIDLKIEGWHARMA